MAQNSNFTGPVQEQFCKDLTSLALTYNLTPEEFAGALLGAGVTVAKDCGLNKGQIIATVSKSYREGPANDG